MFYGFPKPQNKFIRDMVYGLLATGDTIITDIARAVAPVNMHRNVENRLIRNLQTVGLHEKSRDAIQADAVRFIQSLPLENSKSRSHPSPRAFFACRPHNF